MSAIFGLIGILVGVIVVALALYYGVCFAITSFWDQYMPRFDGTNEFVTVWDLEKGDIVFFEDRYYRVTKIHLEDAWGKKTTYPKVILSSLMSSTYLKNFSSKVIRVRLKDSFREGERNYYNVLWGAK